MAKPKKEDQPVNVENLLQDDNSECSVVEELTEKDRKIIQKLSSRGYHLPDYTYCQDFVQFLCNNHPILGFFLSHKLHPFTVFDRIFCLVGSAAFGLAATCGVFLLIFYLHQLDDEVGGWVEVHDWVLAGWAAVLNSCFDMTLWYLRSCPCCQPGARYDMDMRCGGPGWVWLGRSVAGLIVLVAAASALTAFMLQTWLIEENPEIGAESFSFLSSWSLEFGLSLFIVSPIMFFIFFSGILGCFRFPFLGGRPYEIRREQKENMQKENKKKGAKPVKDYVPPSGDSDV
uniref:Transmembrane protein n=1 Tax=Trieres chinensis TaxID=1514140 RepID=A0A7S1Z8E5_TRICV|mmetsp:Transcript_19943/g.40396  ORF Transcript_19943/g.40396 Transcript_19943/m.40396 type:complete len:287 (+) Transcript_19943:159-1019(+)|eukprot:CAMPEP_0183317544 /NCGR_PEP_ID=MMETSP0160_2-20130417/58206_1 /TAXON_ID=2839 ORGANISM="Odontella Sinensis, Strain Grunow 1884" /NCGR_SAMPLE_ID=MMETSP0160_2 /ASSEMBLY_ACC=CAM_ASM_000250 /LENGTH=286 /DNA_ID=CAMNT_0025483587 /DNA_START=93 /DNA_END=953 /DNA_ORIENTATION=+